VGAGFGSAVNGRVHDDFLYGGRYLGMTGKPKRGKRAEFFLSLAGNKHRFGDTVIRFMKPALRRLPYIAKNKSSDTH
jgi:hypothetical protein